MMPQCAVAVVSAVAALAAQGADAAGDSGGFCCWAADDLTDFCGTCLPMAVAGPTSYCSKSQAACGSCGSATWCEEGTRSDEKAAAGTELLLSFDGTRALARDAVLGMRVGGKTYNVTVVDSSFEAFPTPAPTPAPTAAAPAPTPAPALVAGTLVPNVEAVQQHGRLRVQGSRIVGEHGLPVRLRGVSMFWSQWMGQFWNDDVVRWLRDDWHCNVVRAAMGVETGGYLEDADAQKQKVVTVVEAAIAAGIYVIIDWHEENADQHATEAKAFFSEMAQRYGMYPNVLFETFNEPTEQSWSDQIKPYHEQIVSAIREHSRNLAILGTGLWSQRVDEAADDPVSGENIAYTLHFYSATHGQDLRDKAQQALDKGVALFVTEWGASSADGDGVLDLDAARAWLSFLEESGISCVNWSVCDKDEKSASLKPGASHSGGWADGDLSESGVFVRDALRSYWDPASEAVVLK
mmetsp:Transcript_12708/g.34591  ORF Transcript_12708/g.34591 Transcript_12708/m.34591 type:complete len:464 (-) Transcript_12708:512-1903(-)